MKGLVVYDGPSVLTGEPIVVIATLSTVNRKTGDLVQTWILRSDVDPITASKEGKDSAICGNCPLRQNIGGACYVNIGQAPSVIFRAYKNGSYEPMTEKNKQRLKYRVIRLGSYGDPAAVPFDVWTNLLSGVRAVVGYTHQVNHGAFDARILKWCMVSAETAKQAATYHAKGWRTFRITTNNDMFANEVTCPSEQGVSCYDCLACNGSNENKSITIPVHGVRGNKHVTAYDKANIIAVSSN